MRDDQFEVFDPSRYAELRSVGSAYKSYLNQAKEGGESPLLFHGIPHVLVAGPIDVRDLPVIAWEPPQTTAPGAGHLFE